MCNITVSVFFYTLYFMPSFTTKKITFNSLLSIVWVCVCVCATKYYTILCSNTRMCENKENGNAWCRTVDIWCGYICYFNVRQLNAFLCNWKIYGGVVALIQHHLYLMGWITFAHVLNTKAHIHWITHHLVHCV